MGNSKNSYLEIDLDKVVENYNYIKGLTNSKVMAVVKANAYGLGIVEIAKVLKKAGADFFGVAFYEEAIKLIKSGIKEKILIFNYIKKEYLNKLININNIIITIYSIEQLNGYIDYMGDNINKLKIHLKVNTGLDRLGIREEDLNIAIKLIKKYNLKIEGIYSHFANASGNEGYTRFQDNNFNKIIKKFEENNILFRVKHISNSAATLLYRKFDYDYVRVGMAIYGLQPLEEYNNNIKEVLTLKSIISGVFNVKKGENIGYGLKTAALKNMKIAIIPIGYSDGYLFQLSSKGLVEINGIECNIVGEVCMDQIIVDVSKIENLKIEDEVIVIGGKIGINRLAKIVDTIPDEILCKLSNSLEKNYIGDV
ncbi:alanine racemase [Haliovirga abyssi]|uniref:Alanine racemase n=1 Tax=Haliovirga abyssi TaxID=2996794 RepID=A0AAU9DEI8_9FUSO|nr:alanine racemase [Haliovirga abyssi]BDU50762.1 alanine racemase [Haliovirga abyssi]